MVRIRAEHAWREIRFPRPFALDAAVEILQRLAADPSLGTIVLETRKTVNKLRFLIGATPSVLSQITDTFVSLVPSLTISETSPREGTRVAFGLRGTESTVNVAPESVAAAARALMAALTGVTLAEDETIVLQVMLGERLSPLLFRPDGSTARAASLFDWRTPNVTDQSPATYGFKIAVRIGVVSDSPVRAQRLLHPVLAAVRLTQSRGSVSFALESPRLLHGVERPRHTALRIDTRTAAGLVGWPIGELVPGMPSEGSRPLAPKTQLVDTDRIFAVTSAPAHDQPVGIPAVDSLTHTLFMAPTSAGKSTSIARLALADIDAGRGLLLLDPKSDLITAILERIPEHRLDDVVVVDAADLAGVVGFDPLARAARDPWLAADSLLACFRQVWAENWGVRTEEVLSAALLTLARTPGSTLLWIPQLLMDDDFRSRVLASLAPDPLGIDLFWNRYETTPPGPRATLIGPTLTKLQQLLIRPALRSVLGQTNPGLNLAEVFHGKIVLVDLNKGRLGDGASRLLGSLVIGSFWPLVLARADLPPEERGITSIVIDEVQDYLALPGDLASALAQARGLGVGITAGHQYRGQLDDGMLAAFDANMRSKVYFALEDPDATTIASRTDAFNAEDLRALPRFHVYANVMQHGQATGWISGRTLPLDQPLREAEIMRAISRTRYGRPAAQIEREVMRSLGLEQPALL